jgi:hypothetical protein
MYISNTQVLKHVLSSYLRSDGRYASFFLGLRAAAMLEAERARTVGAFVCGSKVMSAAGHEDLARDFEQLQIATTRLGEPQTRARPPPRISSAETSLTTSHPPWPLLSSGPRLLFPGSVEQAVADGQVETLLELQLSEDVQLLEGAAGAVRRAPPLAVAASPLPTPQVSTGTPQETAAEDAAKSDEPAGRSRWSDESDKARRAEEDEKMA